MYLDGFITGIFDTSFCHFYQHCNTDENSFVDTEIPFKNCKNASYNINILEILEEEELNNIFKTFFQ